MDWKFSSESHGKIPLPPASTFAQAFNYLHPKTNSFYLLQHPNGNYIQCGGSKKTCCVELRLYAPDGSYKHYTVGHVDGSETPADIQMSQGVVHVQEREVLAHSEAIELFECFFAEAELPAGYALRETVL